MSAPRWHQNRYATPVPTAPEPWISLDEIVARIEAVREAEGFDSRLFGPIPEPRPLPVGIVDRRGRAGAETLRRLRRAS